MTPDTIGTATVLEPTGLKGRVRPARLIVGAAILIFGAWTSLRYSFGVWGPDADIAAQVVIWQGVLRHGFAFIENWSFTPDNWLFSLSPITALFYTVFGTSPMVVIGVGWLIFVASVGMTARLAHRIAGWRAAFPVAAVLLFSNISTLGNVGFLSYPVSHNISMAWVLLALLLAHHAVARPSAISAIWAGVCVFIDAVSDPWAGPAIALPLVLVSVCLAVLNWRSRKGWYSGGLCAVTAIAFLAARTELFGVLSFLPESSFAMTNAAGLVGNVGWTFRVLSIMFNIVPFADVDSVPGSVVAFLAFAAMLITAVILTIDRLLEAPIERQLVIGVALLSIFGVSAAFLLYAIDSPSLYVGRYFPNVYFFGTLLVSTAIAGHWERLRIPVRAAVVAYVLLFVASGLASNPRLWTGKAEEPLPIFSETSDVKRLGAFLEKNGLTYGYGPYWGAEALAMNWATNGRVTIRAVGFGGDVEGVNGLHPQTSKLFYSPDDEPAGTAETFLVINNDGENCPVLDACVAMAIRQFGEPSRRLTFEESIVLVWPHPIVSKIVDY
jgi:hypothetical protein